MARLPITIAGDSALNIVLGSSINPRTSHRVRAAAKLLVDNPIDGIVDVTPTYCSLMIHYDPLKIRYGELVEQLEQRVERLDEDGAKERTVMELPICYGGEYGPDMDAVAEASGLDAAEVARIHSEPTYFVGMLGFHPGFAYLGGLDNRLHVPRLSRYRTNIAAGSVGIGGQQTGIYSMDTPGGWQIIGRTPLRLFDIDRNPIILLESGQLVRFKPITPEEFRKIQSLVEKGEYQPRIWQEEVQA